MSILYNLFQKIEVEKTYSNLFYDLILKPNKNTTRKENLRSISLTQMQKSSKISANGIQQYIKRVIHHNQVRLIPWKQGWFKICNPINMVTTLTKEEIIT